LEVRRGKGKNRERGGRGGSKVDLGKSRMKKGQEREKEGKKNTRPQFFVRILKTGRPG